MSWAKKLPGYPPNRPQARLLALKGFTNPWYHISKLKGETTWVHFIP
jgi:hypothetical protein